VARTRTNITAGLKLAKVAVLYDGITKAYEQLDESVARAREAGASWSDIGEATNMTYQAAWERWSGVAARSTAKKVKRDTISRGQRTLPI